ERAAREGDAEDALLEGAGLLVLEPLGAGILALVVAPDAVIRLVERAEEVGAGIGEGETVARTVMLLGQAQHRDAVDELALDRDEMLHIELVRHLEEDSAAMRLAARRRERRPGGVVRGERQRLAMLRLGLEPGGNVAGEGEFGQRLTEERLEPRRDSRSVERGG